MLVFPESHCNVELQPDHTRLPTCPGKRESHNLEQGEATVTQQGRLVTTRYGDNYTINSEEFCVDTTNTGDMIAVACNPCQGSEVSIYRIQSPGVTHITCR